MQGDEARVWDVIEKVGICMLTTRYSGGLRARPLEARPDRNEQLIYFLTDVRGLKDDEIAAAPEVGVGLVFIDPEEKVYLSVSGYAEVLRDRRLAEGLWNRKQEVWWSGPDDPNLRVIRMTPTRAEFWDGPASTAKAAFEFAKARVTGGKPDLGENRKRTVEMR